MTGSGCGDRETWPHESCFECRLRMPSDGHADAHYLLTGHQMGWPMSVSELDWPIATDEQVRFVSVRPDNEEAK